MNELFKAYDTLFVIALVVLAVLVVCIMIRAVAGPKIADRIMAVNMIGTMIIMMVSILAVKLSEEYLEDIALIYAMISFLSVVILTKIYVGVHRENLARKQRKEEEQNGVD